MVERVVLIELGQVLEDKHALANRGGEFRVVLGEELERVGGNLAVEAFHDLSQENGAVGADEILRAGRRAAGEEVLHQRLKHLGGNRLHAGHALHDFGAEGGLHRTKDLGRVFGLELREDERPGLALLAAQHLGDD